MAYCAHSLVINKSEVLGFSVALQFDFRIQTDGALKWISARAHGDKAGTVGRVMIGHSLKSLTIRQQVEVGAGPTSIYLHSI